ncbi:MAG TPA: hypothetical protein VGM53_26370 [Streptosporangiaceae bacterium]
MLVTALFVVGEAEGEAGAGAAQDAEAVACELLVVDVPEVAVTVLRALAEGNTLGQTALFAEQVHGEQLDVRTFVQELSELGFIRIPGQAADEQLGSKATGLSLRWLAPSQVSWAFRAPTVAAIGAFILFAFGLAAAQGRLSLRYSDYFVSGYPGVSLGWSFSVVTLAIMLHEFWHLAAARSAGVPARISLSTRLIFLTAQTAAPLMWLAQRKQRFCFYLAGMTCDLVLAAVSALVAAECRSGTWPAAIASSATLILLLGVASQFAFCLRTDVYLVIQELLRCRNLFEDARGYARYRVGRVRARIRGTCPPANPTLELPEHERRPVRAYAAVMVAGSAGLLALTAVYALPISIALYVRAAAGVLSGQPWRFADGLATLVFEGGTQLLLISLLLRRWRQRAPADPGPQLGVRRYRSDVRAHQAGFSHPKLGEEMTAAASTGGPATRVRLVHAGKGAK